MRLDDLRDVKNRHPFEPFEIHLADGRGIPIGHPDAMAWQGPDGQGGIYAIRHVRSGKMYIGSAIDFAARWREHCKRLRLGTHHSRHLQSAWNRDGAAAFVFEILEIVEDKADLIRIEQQYLDRFQTWRRTHGYNARPKADSFLGFRHSPEALAKISAATTRRNTGRAHPKESRAKLSAALLGKKRPGELVARSAAAQRGRKQSPDVAARRNAKVNGRPPEERAASYAKGWATRRAKLDGTLEVKVTINDIRHAKYREPFRPFSIGVADGRQVLVSHRDAIAWAYCRAPVLHVVHADGRWEVVNFAAITSLSPASPAGSTAGGNGS